MVLVSCKCRLPHGRRGLKYSYCLPSQIRTSSPSTRKAWIEIKFADTSADIRPVSPSTRKAWIEITSELTKQKNADSRLPHGRRGLKWIIASHLAQMYQGRLPHGRRGLKSPKPDSEMCSRSGRLPHGRRGLKYQNNSKSCVLADVAFHTEGVD